MKKFNLNDPVSKCYDKVDENTVELKGGFMGICTEIDRYFRLTLNIDLNKPVIFYHTDSFDEIFPNLIEMTQLQLEELRNIYCEIRNINAHLFLSKPIFITSELVCYFSKLSKPQYNISYNNELTIYGMFYILSFLGQKYQLWPFLTETFQCKFFLDIQKKEYNTKLIETQHFLQKNCGLGKPIFFNDKSNKIEIQFFNDTCKRYMTKIFFALEKHILKWIFSSKKKIPSFRVLLEKNQPFANNKELINNLIILRNCWFHGNLLFDTVLIKKDTFIFSLEYVVSTFYKLKTLLKDDEQYDYIIKLIENFGEKLIHFYCLRIVEISYKILDNRLLTEDKINSRIKDLNSAVSRLEQISPKYFEAAISLMSKNEISYKISASKFTDIFPRCTKTNILEIVKIKSENPISIGNFQSDYKEISLALVDIDSEFCNKINNLLIFDIERKPQKFYSSKICIMNACL